MSIFIHFPAEINRREPSKNCVSRINLPLNIKSIREVNIELRDGQSPIR